MGGRQGDGAASGSGSITASTRCSRRIPARTHAVHERIAARDTVYRLARTELVEVLGPQLHTIGPRVLERMRLDNAALIARRIYLTDLDLFDAVWLREGAGSAEDDRADHRAGEGEAEGSLRCLTRLGGENACAAELAPSS